MQQLQSLITQAQNGDLDAFGSIVTQFQDLAVGYAYSVLGDFHLAEDAAQEAFIGAFRDLKMLREPDAFPSWLRRLVFKYCNRLTRGVRLETAPLDAAIDTVADGKNPEALTLEQETKDQVLAAINALPENERVAVTLFYLNGYSQKEIAHFLEVPVSTVDGRLQTARKRLRIALGSDVTEERSTTMVRDNLKHNLPSQDDRFVNKVQLFNAVEAGQVEKAKALLIATPALVNATTEGGQTPLHLAASRGQKEIMRLLLENSAQVDARDSDGRTPLHFMVQKCTRRDVAELLIENGAEVNTTDIHGTTPVSLATDALHVSGIDQMGDFYLLAEFLLDKGATPDIFVASVLGPHADRISELLRSDPAFVNARRSAAYRFPGSTPLHHAAGRGERPIVDVLLSHGADVNAKDEQGRLPLYYAAHGQLMRKFSPNKIKEMVDLLITHGATVDIFAYAITGNVEMATRLLADDPALVHATDALGRTPLQLATAREWEDEQAPAVVEFLIEKGATPDIFLVARMGKRDAVIALLDANPTLVNSRNGNDFTPLHYAARNGHLAVVQCLLERGAAIEPRADDGFTPLHFASCFGHQRVVELLLNQGAEIETQDNFGHTPLHSASYSGHLDIIKQLMNRGADAYARNGEGATPMHCGAFEGHVSVVQFFMEQGMDMNMPGAADYTSLHLAALGEHFALAEFLVQRGANIHAKQRDSYGGDSVLYSASWRGHKDVAQLLIERGADVNIKNDRGSTPLHGAAGGGHEALVKLLLSHGAEINAKDKKGMTLLQIAIESGFERTANLLRQHGATE